jgi:2,4'-dihydroxyacetophenone dioxygenase
MHALEPEPANPLQTSDMPWIPTGPGKSFRPLRFAADGWSELMRIEPGSRVALHRHTGEVHAFNLSGKRRIMGSGEVVGPGDYVYEPGGMVDGWEAVGDEPCVVHFNIVGAVEYLGGGGEVIAVCNSASQRAVYLAWCRERGVESAAGIVGGTP